MTANPLVLGWNMAGSVMRRQPRPEDTQLTVKTRYELAELDSGDKGMVLFDGGVGGLFEIIMHARADAVQNAQPVTVHPPLLKSG